MTPLLRLYNKVIPGYVLYYGIASLLSFEYILLIADQPCSEDPK